MIRNRHHSTLRNGHADAHTQRLQEVIRIAQSGQLDAALEKSTASEGTSPELRNARAVCLMRLGRPEEALAVYRGFVLQSGCTWMKTDLPVHVGANFATAILLCGRALGCEAVLSEIADQDHPSVRRLHAALKRWRSSLPFTARLKRLFGIEPEVPVQLDFDPGDFVDPTAQRSSTVDAMTSSPPRSATQNA